MRTPAGDRPADLTRVDRCFLVRYVDRRGETASELFRKRTAAVDFAEQVFAAGGAPRVYVAAPTWTELA